MFVSVLRFAQAEKERVEKGEISPGTLRNYIKAVKLFCEMNDIAITWKKITRGLSAHEICLASVKGCQDVL